MQLTTEQLKDLSKVAELAATTAGKMIEEVIKNDPSLKSLTVEKKKSGSSRASQVVTKVDLASEKIILELLSPTLEKYDLALLSEETIDDCSRFEKDYFWCIDPLDGTLAFTQGRTGFSVSIALVSKNGVPYLGVVYDPCSQALYSSIKGLGAYKNGAPYRLKQSKLEKTLAKLTIITEPNLTQQPKFSQFLNELEQTKNNQRWHSLELLDGGGAVINACSVLENHPAVYFKLPKPTEGGGSSWDFAATSSIFNELGLTVTDVYGKPLQLNKKGNTFMNHCGVVYASDKALAEITLNSLAKTAR